MSNITAKSKWVIKLWNFGILHVHWIHFKWQTWHVQDYKWKKPVIQRWEAFRPPPQNTIRERPLFPTDLKI